MSNQSSKSNRTTAKRPSALFNGCARSGVAAIETAVTLPLLVFLTFGSLEIANAVFLRQSLVTASYEGAQCATRSGGSDAAARSRIAEVLAARGITSYTVVLTPAVTSTTARGTKIEVKVSSGSSSLSFAPFQIFYGKTISASVTMVRQ
ncbi:MAG: TadE family protein [Pirellula sp.]